MGRFINYPTFPNDIKIIKFDRFDDNRGSFEYSYDQYLFEKEKLNTEWILDKQSITKKAGTIRGLHYQVPPYDEIKLVRVVSGIVVDVFVDLRKKSKTYGQWGKYLLSGLDGVCIYIPSGFAHGFITLTDDVIFNYKSNNQYNPKAEGGIIWNDPDLSIPWLNNHNPILSEKDKKWGNLKDLDSPF